MKTNTMNRTPSRRSNQQKRRSFFSNALPLAKRTGRSLQVETLENRTLLATISNPAAITINDFPPGTATPYPSTINFTLPGGVSASTVNASASLNSLSHANILEVNALVAAPGGQTVELMRFVGTGPVVNETYTFQDGAPAMPFIGDPGTGTFSPTQFGGAVAYPAPAPVGPYGTTMAAVVPSAQTGAWNLFVFDNSAVNTGSVAGGWTLSLQLGGNVVINAGASADDGAADTFLVRRNGANLQILVNAVSVFDEPFAGITSLRINGSGDNDLLTVDFAAGDPLPGGTLVYNAGGGTADAMTLQGGSFNTVRHFLTNATDGSVEFDGDTIDNGGIAETSIVYTGLDPIADNLSAVNRVFDFGAGNDQDVVVRDNAVAGDGLNVIEAPANAESVTFTNPTTSLTVNLGDGDDIMELRRLDSLWVATAINLNGGSNQDEIRVAATPAVATTTINTNAGTPVDRTVLGAIVGSNGDNATDFSQFNTGVSTLDFIAGVVVSVDDSGGVGQLFADDSGDVNADAVTFSASSITGAAPAPINYNGANLDNVQLALGTAADTINVTGTGSFGSTTIFGNGGNDVFTIAGDALSANNSFQGGPGNDAFILNIVTHLGSTASFGILSLLINGNDPAANSENRDRLNINDNNAAFARNLNFDHLDTAGDLDILANVAGAGYAGPVNAGLAVNVRGMETIVSTSTADNDTVRVTSTSADDNLTAVPRAAGQALVFLNGNPYLNAPPASLATFLPGLAGGGRGPDLSLDGIAGNLTLDGGAVSGEGNRAIVQGVSENNITTGGALNIFGFGAGVLIPGTGVNNAYDTINVTDALVTVNNIAQGPLTTVSLVTASFNQTSPDTPFQRAGLVVNGGDEAVAQASGIADNITALVSAVFNIQVNGNLPLLVLGPDGLPRGDQLNITGPGDINIFSDKATPPNVTVTFSGNPGPFGIRHSSIERLALDAGTLPATGAVNLIGDNNNPAVDQNDNFVVRGRDIDGNLLDAGYQEMTVSINGSAPILINGVQRLKVYGDDQNPAPGTPSVGPNDIDTLDIRAYADNAGNPPNNAPRGWGVDVFFNEGNPVGNDGNQSDLIIYHTSAGLGGGGSVSENIVVQPAGPDNGEIRASNATDGSVVVTVQYVANTDIIVLDDDGALADTDSLTLNGTNPNGPQTSGRDTFIADFTNTGVLGDEKVVVTDSAGGAILYRLRNFTGFNSINLAGLAGADTIVVTTVDGLTVNVDGGLPAAGAAGVASDTLSVIVPSSASITQGADSTTGQVLTSGGAVVNFAAVETVSLASGDLGTLTVNATDDNDTIAAANLGANLVWVNDGPVIIVNGFSALTLNGRFGHDSFSISPVGFGVTTINVNGGDPTASDTVVVNGTAAADAITFTPSAADAGTVQVNAAPVVNLATVEHLTINGLGGNDNLTATTPAGISVTQYTPGAVLDSGTVLVASRLPLAFSNLGNAGSLTLANAGGRIGSLVYNGTNTSDIFLVDAAGTINLRTVIGSTINPRSLPVLTPGIGVASLKGLEGDDSFDVVGNHPFTLGLSIDGGDPSASDTLNFTGAGASITVALAAHTITETGFGPVSYTGVEHVNVDATAAAVAVNGSANNDQITVSHDAGLVTEFRRAGDNSVVRVSDVGAALTLDTLAGTDSVTVLGSAAADTVAVTYGATTTVAVTGQQVLSLTSANLENLTLSTGAGNDAVTLNGNANITTLVDAGDPNANDTLTYNVAASARVTQAAISTNGKIDQTGGSEVDYIGVELLNMNSAAGGSTLTARGTDDNDTIAVGLVGITAVWINDGTVIRYNALTDVNFANVIVQGRFGNDSFSVTPHVGVAITVQGGDPTASDTVVVNGTAAVDTIVFTPTAADAGTVLVNALPVVTLATVEHLTINGLGGNDTLNTVTPAAASSDIEITPGATPDSGDLQVDSLIPLSFTNLGAAGRLTITDVGVDRDRVIYNGTAADNVFRVPDSGGIPAPSLELTSHLGVGTTGIETYVLRGLSGDDRFEVVAQAGIIVDVQGGDPGASDVLAFTSTGATTVNLGNSQIDDAGVAGSPDVVYSGIETINVNANANPLAVVASAVNDDLTVTVFSATSGKVEARLAVQQNGQNDPGVASPVLNYINLPASPANALAVDMAGGVDTLVVVGNALAQTFDVNAAGSVAIDDGPNGVGNDGRVTFINTESLEAFGLAGNDRFNVTAGAIPVFIDGGDPIGVLPGDTIVPIGSIGFFPGPESDEGGFLTLGAAISFDHIESIVIGPNGPCAFLILGTNADDDITVIARDASTHVGTDGVQDFTVSVNAGPDLLFIDEPDLFIDALSGDDDIVIRTPAPNDAPWNVNVRVAGGPPSIGEPNEADRLVLETPGIDDVEFRPTGPETGSLVINEGLTADYQPGEGDSIITFGPFVFVCDDPVGPPIEFTYISSPGGVELVQYDGEIDVPNGGDDTLSIFGTLGSDTTTVNPIDGGTGTFVSSASPLFHFRFYETLSVNGGGGGFDHLIVNLTEGVDGVSSSASALDLNLPDGLDHLINIGTGIDQLNINALGGNDSIDLDLQLLGLAKVIDAGAGNDTVNLSGVIIDPADPVIFGGIGDDVLIGSPNPDQIFGGAGNDILIGGGGIDQEYGEDGNDRFGDLLLTGNGVADDPGADFMFGGDGIDQFIWEPGDGADVIQGGVDGADILRFFGSAAAELFTLNPAAGAPTHFNITINAAPTIDTHGVEQIIVSGLGGADSFVVADLTPTEVEDVILDVGAAGDADNVRVIGRTVSDNVAITVPAAGRINIAGMDYDVEILGVALADLDTLSYESREGNDTILASDDLSTLFSSSEVNLIAGSGDDFVSGFGTLFGDAGNDTLVGGAFGQTINGGDGDDQIFGGGGADALNGNAGEDTFVPGFDGLIDSIDGGADFDTILVQGNSANNRIDARQDAIGQVSYEISGVNGGDGVLGGAGTETDVIVPGTVEQLTILAGSGDDVIRVAHNDSLIVNGQQAQSLRFTVDGGAPGASDRLSVTDELLGDTTIHRIGGIAGNGSFQVGALAPVVYTDIEFASLDPLSPITGGTGADGQGTLFVFKHDPFESNDSRLNATFLGSNSAINVDPTIDPGADALFGLPGDEDWYRVVPQFNGDLDIRVFFRQQGLLANGRAGLPGNGNLDIALYDADGAPVEIAGTGAFGTNDATDDERVRIPAVAGQTYFLRVKGAALANLSSAALNVYNVSVINTPAATPIDLELDDVIGVATVDAAPVPSATQFDATAVAPFVLSTVNDFYNGKDIVFTSGNLNGLRGRILDFVGASQTFVFAAGTFAVAPGAGSTFQIESADTGRSQLDNITRDTTPTIFLRVPNVVNVGGVATLDDVPFNGTAPGAPPDEFIGIPFVPGLTLDATAPGFRVPIFITEHGTSDQGPPNNVLAGYAQPVDPVNRPGLFSFTFGSPGSLITELPVFPGTSETTSFFLSARVEVVDPAQPQQAQGYGDYAQSLEIVVDTQPPPVFFGLPNDPDDGLLPNSDTGLNTNPETLNDLVTSDTTPGFFGQAEADAVIRLFIDAPQPGFPTGNGIFQPAIDFQIGFDVAEPFDGTNQYPNGYWQVDAVNVNLNAPPFDPIDGLRRIFVTAEDVAGNINPEVGQVVQEFEIFLDVQGPQITDVTVNAPSGTIGDDYNLFDPKPSTDGPTPLVNSIFIEIRDLPNRVLPVFDQPAFKPDIAENPGHYLVTGDYNGIIPILDVEVFLDPAVNGQPATGRVQLIFRTAGADGVFNTSDDIGAALPDDRFTLFVNDEGIIDFAGNIGDFESNADEPHDSPPGPGEPDVLGVDGVPTGDGLPGGDFFARFTVDTRPELGVWAAGSAFLDINGNTIWDPDNADFTNRDITHVMGYVSDDLFSGRFASDDGEGGLFDDGFDKLGAYGRVGTTTFRWLIDTDNDGVADIEHLDPANVNGLPVAGNFATGAAFPGDEVGLFTGSTWRFDTNHNFEVDVALPWTLNGVPVAGHPIVGDFDGDGLDDLGSWTDDTFSFDLSSINSVAGGLPGNTGIDGTIEKQFRFGFAGPGERPVAADMNQDGIEDVGLWMPARDGITPRGQAEWYFLISGVTQNDTAPNVPANLGPTITGTFDPPPGAYLANPAQYGLANYTTGRIVVDPLFPGTNVVRFQPVPFGNDQYMQFGDEFALPLVGNFDPPVTTRDVVNPAVNPRNRNDVNNDGKVNQIDLLAIVNWLTINGVGAAPSSGFVAAPYVDTNDDLFVNSTDLLVVLNYLTHNPPGAANGGAGDGAAEGEGGSADDYFARLGSGSSTGGDDDEWLDLLARR